MCRPFTVFAFLTCFFLARTPPPLHKWPSQLTWFQILRGSPRPSRPRTPLCSLSSSPVSSELPHSYFFFQKVWRCQDGCCTFTGRPAWLSGVSFCHCLSTEVQLDLQSCSDNVININVMITQPLSNAVPNSNSPLKSSSNPCQGRPGAVPF